MPQNEPAADIDEYVRTFSPEVRATLEGIRRAIRAAVPGAEEAFSYKMPAFSLNGKLFIWFAAYPHHISLYPIPAGDAALQKELAPYVAGKGTLKFPLAQPMPWETVNKAIRALARQSEDGQA
jgi:uncharacterized protein YdhG (YjbR/CyaY superfamily)